MRLIDADALIESIKRVACTDCNSYEGVRCRACWADDAMCMADDAPEINAVPVVHARWTDDGVCTHCKCTAQYTEYTTEKFDYDWNENLVPCGVEIYRTYHTTDYCPTCGARMDDTGKEDIYDGTGEDS